MLLNHGTRAVANPWGTPGGQNRLRILFALSEQPQNANRLADGLNLDYTIGISKCRTQPSLLTITSRPSMACSHDQLLLPI